MYNKINVGGQAVIEGVMIRGPKKYTVACRKGSKIVLKKGSIPTKKNKFLNFPFVRGFVNLMDMMIIGIKSLMWSAEQQTGGHEKIGKNEIFWTMLFSFAMVVLFFIALPYFLTSLFGVHEETKPFMFNFVDGLIRISIFVLYIFAISFMKDVKVLFQYHGAEHMAIHCHEHGFALDKKRVTKEKLSAYPEGKTQLWYERNYDPNAGKDRWDFGSKFTGQRHVWREATRQNALFLSTAIQLNSEQLKPVFNWFKNKITIIGIRGVTPRFSIDACDANEDKKKQIVEFLNSADISISDIEVKKTTFTPKMFPLDLPLNIYQTWKDHFSKNLITEIRFKHQTMNGESVYFEMEDESHGTRKLFAFAGPWLDVLAKGKIIVIDELDTSLHPLMVRYLISLIQNQNKNNAQLIFTTHDTSLLSAEMFRRDQIWFVEKDRENASRLYPLSEFKTRKNEAFENGYLKGRYGALPSIEDFSF